jgi:tRNA pseudouridine55 synthase
MSFSGILVVDKPGAVTSHDVVAKVRRIFGTRKVGHAGTLDPMATGVLVIGINHATRLLGHLTLSTKSYQAVIRLGAASTTDDAEGVLSISQSTSHLSEKEILQSLASQVGTFEQVPSSVSAIRVNGRRAHEMVRSGESITLAARTIEVSSLAVSKIERSVEPFTDIHVSVDCSAGTYVRAIARDLGQDLGVGGHLVELRRTASGPFTLDHAAELVSLEHSAQPWDFVQSMGQAASQVWPTVMVDSAVRGKISKGQRLSSDTLPHGETLALLDPDGSLVALVRNSSQGMAYRAVFIGVS